MIKKRISLILLFILFSTTSIYKTQADGVSVKSFKELYNISYHTNIYYPNDDMEDKITSYGELVQQFSKSEDILSEYNEAFFENRFLYRICYHAPDPSWEVDVTNVTITQDSINIEVTAECKPEGGTYYPASLVPWDILFEFDNAHLDKTISSKVFREMYIYDICDEAFEQNDIAFIRMDYYPYNKTITIGGAELYYNSQKMVYFGLVDAKDIDVENQSAVIGISNNTPTTFTYGNLVANSSDEANMSDLHAMKLIIEKNILPDEPYLLASDLNGDGQCNISDLQAMKQYIEMGIDFPVLN